MKVSDLGDFDERSLEESNSKLQESKFSAVMEQIQKTSIAWWQVFQVFPLQSLPRIIIWNALPHFLFMVPNLTSEIWLTSTYLHMSLLSVLYLMLSSNIGKFKPKWEYLICTCTWYVYNYLILDVLLNMCSYIVNLEVTCGSAIAAKD